MTHSRQARRSCRGMAKLTCKVSAHSVLVVLVFVLLFVLHTSQIIPQFLGCDKPTESIQSAWRKPEDQNLISGKHRTVTLANHLKWKVTHVVHSANVQF